ncbi:TonB-dependent receptor [Frigidibacter mobilis]|uniref:TonB-dependent receptor n=1 Tax=Frigidibacter mobilis TaxID=1335048 RepID=A0A159Z9H4_9RHOB|nr:TonB-dependent receptor [Frigidibacter mobilis]AMY71488.1 TonB-dependent receptor [Frigidibacter mobilis]
MSHTLTARLRCGASTLALAVALAAPAARAQEGTAPTLLDTIYLTGEKNLRDVKSTAASVSVFGEDEMEDQKAGKATVDEVIATTPNLIYPDNVSAPVIRGIDTQGPQNGSVAFFAGTVPRGTVNIDGHYLGFYELYFGATAAWDVDSIEVFSGPQTTSQGANAIAGAIIVNTKDPSFTPEGAYRIEAGSENAKRLSFAWSGPLSQDFAARLAVDYSARDTIIDYTNAGFVLGKSDLDFESLSLRGKLLWAPQDIDGLEVKLTYAHTDTNRPTQEMATGSYDDLENGYALSIPSWDQVQDTLSVDVDYDLGNGIKLFNQTQASSGSIDRRVSNGNGDADIDSDEISNEIRLSFGQPEDTLSGMVGFYAKRTETDEALRLSTGDSQFDDTKTNLGLFADGTWRFSDRWSLNAGLRFQQDRIERAGVSSYATDAADFDHTFEALLPKLSLSYEATPDWTVGAMVSRGYNPGGMTLNFTSKAWEEFDDETITNYELFSRATLLENRLFLTTNLFYMDYRDAQYNVAVEVSPSVFQTYTINAEEAHAYGLELGLDYRPTDTLNLRASAGLLKSNVDEITGNTAFEGNVFAKSPEVTLSLGADWAATEKFSIGGQVRHVGGYFSDIGNTEAYEVDSYTLTDLQASYAIRDGVELYGYVNNVFDERTPTFMQFNRTGGGTEASVTMPRTVGIGLRGTF